MRITGYDFSGWATKNDLRCADNRVIRKGAFKIQDGAKVPLMWNHKHDSTSAVLGHAILENRDDGIYTYGFFNNTNAGREAKELLKHGDIEALSIYANNLVQDGNDVLHGAIREVSLVLAGANPGAFVESVMSHGEPLEEYEDEGLIFTGENIFISHSDDYDYDEEVGDVDDRTANEIFESMDEDQKNLVYAIADELLNGDDDDEFAHSAFDDDADAEEVFDSMTDEQQALVYAIADEIVNDYEEGDDEDYEEGDDDYEEDDDDFEHSGLEEDYEMKRNVFDQDMDNTNVIAHSAILSDMLEDAKTHRAGSLKEIINDGIETGVLQHSIDTTGMIVGDGDWRSIIPEGRPTTYGFNDPDMLFPDPKSLNNPPEWIQRNMDWVSVVLNGVHRSPFSRIKSQFANITEDEARAKGYTKTHKKTEEMFSVLKRVTTPTTIYKKQRMDRDDIVDITDFDVVAWIKGEMRVMLNEEIARAILVGDGRAQNSADKIDESAIRPIIKDDPLFNTKVAVSVAHGATGETKAKTAIDAIIRARKNYKGSGTPILFTTEDWVTEMLLIKDQMGHYMYETEATLATRLRVSRIVTVELLENQTVPVSKTEGGSTVIENKPLLGVIVNPVDYNVGADKGGSIELFDDFDIDFNQYVWLMEGRMSGALVKPFSALTVYVDEAAAG